ncbi:NAD-dependent protein deacetylase sirtuin-2-like [Ptychodera flava]|uniref:NAD-dependent protein deacetylase sirtuin-2-like n=1 Tax=Ptychodera flava TaxID=63121 RepID=UPI003969D2D9
MDASKEPGIDEPTKDSEKSVEVKEKTSKEKKETSSSSGLDTETISAALQASADLDRKWKEMEDKMKQMTVQMAKVLQRALGGASTMQAISEEEPEQLLDELSLEGVVKYIKAGKCKNIITMAGAGISTAAGIPDFRSAGTGLYDSLDVEKYNLPSPQSLFSIDFFKKNPEPFFKIRVKEYYLKVGDFKPTLSHYFIRLLADEGLLLRHYTQNIDTLDMAAGIPEDKTVLAHGSFASWKCLGEDCNTTYSLDWIKKIVNADKIPRCTKCDAVIKPGIVMFGEQLPKRFAEMSEEDFPKCDLLIVLGTSLAVQPFASLVNRVPASTPRLLINRDKPGAAEATDALGALLGMPASASFMFDCEDNYRDVAYLGACDDGTGRMAELLGWKKKLEKLMRPGCNHVQVPAEKKTTVKRKAGNSKGTK